MHVLLDEMDSGEVFYVKILVAKQFTFLQSEFMWGVHDNLLSKRIPK